MVATKTNAELYEKYVSTHFGEHQSPSDEASFRAFELNFRPLLPTSKDAHILDIGCGMGTFLRFLVNEGYRNAEGFEVSAEQLEACRRSGLSNVRKVDDTVAELDKMPERYDFVVMTDVLEHIPKSTVIPLLRAIYGALRHGGSAAFRVPNLAAFGGAVRRYYDFTHEVGFVETSMKQVLRVAGFESVDVVPDNPAFRSPIKGALLMGAREALWGLMKLAMFIEGTGDLNPQILSKNIIGVGRKA